MDHPTRNDLKNLGKLFKNHSAGWILRILQFTDDFPQKVSAGTGLSLAPASRRITLSSIHYRGKYALRVILETNSFEHS